MQAAGDGEAGAGGVAGREAASAGAEAEPQAAAQAEGIGGRPATDSFTRLAHMGCAKRHRVQMRVRERNFSKRTSTGGQTPFLRLSVKRITQKNSANVLTLSLRDREYPPVDIRFGKFLTLIP